MAFLLLPEGTIEFINEAAAMRAGRAAREMVGRDIREFFPESVLAGRREMAERAFTSSEVLEFHDESDGCHFHHVLRPVADESGKTAALAVVVRDITPLVEARQALEAAHAAVWQKDAALREVLAFLESERNAVRDQVVANRDGLILPLLLDLRTRLSSEHAVTIAAIEQALANIADPFVLKLIHRYGSLSPREIEVCVMIKQGLSSKEIADRLSVSLHTIHKFRQRIRRKLDITNAKWTSAAFFCRCRTRTAASTRTSIRNQQVVARMPPIA
jgi:PAS domain S-box-containing protein